MAAVAEKTQEMILRIRETVRRIPKGKVSTYGAVAEAAGFPRAPRMVARALKDGLVPWHRVLGAGGRISLTGHSAFEQRFRLESEGVAFKGKRVDMNLHEHKWKTPPVSRKAKRTRVS
jgi:methylated-DNA-protein-cysteine methyltransferase related protein